MTGRPKGRPVCLPPLKVVFFPIVQLSLKLGGIARRRTKNPHFLQPWALFNGLDGLGSGRNRETRHDPCALQP